MERLRSVGEIVNMETFNAIWHCPQRSSYAVFCFICFRKVSCGSAISDSLPIGAGASFCRFAFSASTQLPIRPQPKIDQQINLASGIVLDAEDRWLSFCASIFPDGSHVHHRHHPYRNRNLKIYSGKKWYSSVLSKRKPTITPGFRRNAEAECTGIVHRSQPCAIFIIKALFSEHSSRNSKYIAIN